MSDALRRAIRTYFQGFVGVLAIVAVPVLKQMVDAAAGGDAITINVDVWQGIALAAVAGGVIALISWAQNFLEDNVKAVPAPLKAPASEGQNPVPNDGGTIA